MMPNLMPCPMPTCGTPIDAVHLVPQGMGAFTYVIRCDCGLSFDTGAQNEAAAVDRWNERPAPRDPRDLFIVVNPCGAADDELEKDHSGFSDMRTHGDYMIFLAGYQAATKEADQ
jgi:hypothetical protein